MPFVALNDGKIVVPEDVHDGAMLTFVDCGGKLRVRASHERNDQFVARHFWHPGGADGCSGGESDTHRRMKSIALSKIKDLFPCETAGLEKRIGRNVADVYAKFDEPVGKFGDGVVIEVQHRNKDKDIESVTENYLHEGYSVCWISDASIDGRDIDLSEPDWHYVEDFDQSGQVRQLPPEFTNPDRQTSDDLTCPHCAWEPPLKPVDREHLYETGQVFQCRSCSSYFIQKDAGRDFQMVPVHHESSLSMGESSQWLDHRN